MASSQQHDINPEVLRLIETFSPVANTFDNNYLEYCHIYFRPPEELDQPSFMSFMQATAISSIILKLDINWLHHQGAPDKYVIDEYNRQCMAGEVAY